MKNVIKMLIFVISTVGFAQENGVNANNNTLGALASYGVDGANVGGTSVIYNPPRNIEGSVYLFDSWENNGVIETEKASFKLRNINFNARKNVFEAQIPDTDSIFTFDFKNVNRMVVNNRVFKNVYSPIEGGYKIYEVIAESGDYAVYRDNYIEIKEGNPNPMLVQGNDKFVKRDSHFVKNKKSFKRLKVNKAVILKSFGNKGRKVEEYAKENDLSFKNEQHLQKIVDYYSTL